MGHWKRNPARGGCGVADRLMKLATPNARRPPTCSTGTGPCSSFGWRVRRYFWNRMGIHRRIRYKGKEVSVNHTPKSIEGPHPLINLPATCTHART